TSGQLMSATALLAANTHPTRDDVRAALTGNICRCSGYNHYVDAVLGTAAGANPTPTPKNMSEGAAAGQRVSFSTVGHATPRIDGVERVSGKATYSGDVMLPGMLYARVL